MSWLSKQLKSAKKLVTHPADWAQGAGKTIGKGLQQTAPITAGILAATGVGAPLAAGLLAGSSALGSVLQGKNAKSTLTSAAKGGLTGGLAAAGGGGVLSKATGALGKTLGIGGGAAGAAGAAGAGAAAGGGGWGNIASQIGGAALGSVPGVMSPGMGGAPGGGGGWVSDAMGGISGWLGQDGNKRKLLETLAYGIPAGMSLIQGHKAEGRQNDLLGRQMALGDQTAAIGQGLIDEATPLRQTAQQQMLAALTGGAGSVPTPPDLSQFINRRNPFAAQYAQAQQPPRMA